MFFVIDKNKRNHMVDLLKGVCMIFIITTHFSFADGFFKNAGFYFWIEMAVPVLMIITGYIWSYSYNSKDITFLGGGYNLRLIINKLLRLLIPFLFIYVIDVFLLLFVSKERSFMTFVSVFFQGGSGPGSYYVPVMVQTIFIFPFIYIAIRKYGFKGVIVMFILTLFFEVLKFPFHISNETYRLLAFRYIFTISFGSYLFQLKQRISNGYILNKKIYVSLGIVSTLIGATFIVATQYLNWTPYVLKYWTSTCCVASLFICFLASLLILFVNLKFYPIELIGRASFNIFLVQMTYYYIVAPYVYNYVPYLVFQYVTSLFSCLIVGIMFYLVERRITSFVIKKVDYLYGIIQ